MSHRLAYGSKHFKSCFPSTVLVLCALSVVRCRACSYGGIILALHPVVQSQDLGDATVNNREAVPVSGWLATTLPYMEVIVNHILTSHKTPNVVPTQLTLNCLPTCTHGHPSATRYERSCGEVRVERNSGLNQPS